MSYRLAIDLGSSNTVAVLQGVDGRARSLLFDGSELLPSGVCADAGGDLVVGRDAERLARAEPAAYEPSPKRRIDDGTVLLGPHVVDVRDALAAVLVRVAGQLRPGGSEPGSVVLTCPAAWGAPRRQVLAEAGARAGLAPVTLVSEPIAAAAYFLTVLRCELPPGAALMVVDLGAGTADVAVVRRAAAASDSGDREVAAQAGLDVVAQAGLDVGGVDIDAALVDLVGTLVAPTAPEVWRALVDPATPAERRDRLALWREVHAAKESLSRLSVAPVQVPGHEVDLHITREELEARATPLLAPIGELAAQVVAAAGLTPDRLAGVFLVGGGSRIPLLARLLHTRLAVASTVVERPETVVAEGALYAVATGPAGHPPAVDPSAGDPAATPALAPGPARRGGRGGFGWQRWPGPAALVLVLLCFLLPFATVSCGLPDGYGRAGPGGTTTYAGIDLVWGGSPDVPAEHLRPPSEWRPDRLAPQPLLLAALLAAGAAVLAALAASLPWRRVVVAGLATASALSLLVGQAVVVGLLTPRVRAQSALPAGRTADEFVGTGIGFWLALALLTATAAGNAFGLLRHRRPGTNRASTNRASTNRPGADRTARSARRWGSRSRST